MVQFYMQWHKGDIIYKRHNLGIYRVIHEQYTIDKTTLLKNMLEWNFCIGSRNIATTLGAAVVWFWYCALEAALK